MYALNSPSTLTLLAVTEVSQRGARKDEEKTGRLGLPRDQEPPGQISPLRFPGRTEQALMRQPVEGVLHTRTLCPNKGQWGWLEGDLSQSDSQDLRTLCEML